MLDDPAFGSDLITHTVCVLSADDPFDPFFGIVHFQFPRCFPKLLNLGLGFGLLFCVRHLASLLYLTTDT